MPAEFEVMPDNKVIVRMEWSDGDGSGSAGRRMRMYVNSARSSFWTVLGYVLGQDLG